MKISSRLTVLIAIQLLFLVIIGAVAYSGMERISQSVSQANATAKTQANLTLVTESVRSNLLGMVNSMVLGSMTWEAASASLLQASSEIEKNWERYAADIKATASLNLDREKAVVVSGIEEVRSVIKQVEELFNLRDRSRLTLFVSNDLEELISPFFKSMLVASTKVSELSDQALADARQASQRFQWLIAGLALFGLFASMLIGSVIYFSFLIRCAKSLIPCAKSAKAVMPPVLNCKAWMS